MLNVSRLLGIAVLLFALSGNGFAQLSDLGIVPNKTYAWFGNQEQPELNETAQPIVLVPPSCGKKRRDNGNDLALPFGATAVYRYTRQFYNASNLLVTDDSTGIYAIGEANVQNSTAGDMSLSFRPDVWVIPILNVYGLFGYSRSVTKPDFEVPSITIKNIPILEEITLDTAIAIQDELVFYGSTYGGGATVSAGVKSFFFVFDYNYTINNPREVPDKIESHNLSLKLGVLLGKNEKKVKGMLWAGVNYIKDDHQFTGELTVADILPELGLLFGETATYSGSLTAKNYWNLLIGASVIINKHHIIAFEGGYFDREVLSLSYGFRF